MLPPRQIAHPSMTAYTPAPTLGKLSWTSSCDFRLYRVALIGDVEKAFLMVSVADCDRDVLRFLWISDVKQSIPETIVLRFTQVVFRVSASPFLLNATIGEVQASR